MSLVMVITGDTLPAQCPVQLAGFVELVTITMVSNCDG